MPARRIMTTVLLAALFLTVVLPAGVALGATTTVTAKVTLKGSSAYPTVRGEAKWKSKASERELEVQIQGAKKLKGKKLTVRIDGKIVGYMNVTSLGTARLYRNTTRGARVPTVVINKLCTVRTASGTLVASGRLRLI